MAGNKSFINPKGGNKLLISEYTLISNVWTIVTPVNGVTGLDLGEINTSSFDSATTDSLLKNEALQTVYTQTETADVVEAVLMERSAALQEFLRYSVADKFYLLYYYQGIAGGKWQEELSIGQVVPQKNNSFPSGATSFKFKFNKLVQEIDLTISAANLTAIEVAYTATIKMAGPVTILANRFDKLTETTVV